MSQRKNEGFSGFFVTLLQRIRAFPQWKRKFSNLSTDHEGMPLLSSYPVENFLQGVEKVWKRNLSLVDCLWNLWGKQI